MARTSFGLPRLLRLATLAALPLLLGGCELGVLDPKGPVAASERLILIDSLAIMMVIVIPVLAATVGFAWWFRAGNEKAFYLPEWEFNGTIELIVWSIPLLVIVVLGGVAWFGSHALDPYAPLTAPAKATADMATGDKATGDMAGMKMGSKEAGSPAPAAAGKPLEVQVVSMDWKWLFIYPDQGIAAVNALYVPTGKPVHFTITSASVWNAFFVPQLGSMIYSMAGMATQVSLQADEPGVYRGISAMFSGEKFADMHFDVHAVKDDAFAKWVADAKGSGDALDTAGYAKLAGVSDTAPVATYKSIDKNLFAAIVNQTAPSPAGPPNVTNAP